MLHEMHEKMKHLQAKAHETDLYQLSEVSPRNNAAKSFVSGVLGGWRVQACTMGHQVGVFYTFQLGMLWLPRTEQ